MCSHCVKEMHRTHHIMNIDDAASAKLRELNKKLNALEHYEADRLNKKIESIEEDKLQYLKKTSEQRMDVRNRNEKIMDVLNDLTDNILQEIDTKEQIDLQFLTRKESQMRMLLDSYHKTASLCRENLNEKDGVIID